MCHLWPRATNFPLPINLMAKLTKKKTSKDLQPSKQTEQTKEIARLPAVDNEASRSDSEEDSEDEGVDEVGFTNLLNLLGHDGLDDFDQAQLQALGGEEVCEEDSDLEQDEDDKGEDSESEQEEDGDDDKIAAGSSQHGVDKGDLALDEVDDVLDEDTVPQQKLQIDNKVRFFFFCL
jgi:rRNA-processing protein EBP2